MSEGVPTHKQLVQHDEQPYKGQKTLGTASQFGVYPKNTEKNNITFIKRKLTDENPLVLSYGTLPSKDCRVKSSRQHLWLIIVPPILQY